MGRIDKVPTARRRTITNKTRLKVVDGDVPTAELVLLEEDDNKHKSLDIDTAGVEHEDAKEEHLVQVLAAAARRIGSGRASKPNEEIASASIPIPDATGVVENYAEHYPSGRWIDPGAFVKSSDSVEQSIEGFLLNGISYDMDERDVAWLDKHNSAAKGEGTSSGAGSPDRSRAAKMRGKDVAAEQPSFVISENEFEFAMGLFEKITDEKCPYLHLDISGLPPLSEYEPSFHVTPSRHYFFASFQIPSYCRDSDHLVQLARIVYPYWKGRKIAREGRKIIPQLNLDESNDTDPFVCFRRRDAKAVRKTRRADNTPADKITRLRIELQQVSDLAASVVTREMKKAELGKDSQNVLEARLRLFDHKRRFPHLSSPQDDQMLIEQERPPTKRLRMSEREPVGSGILRIPRRPRESVDLPSPYAPSDIIEAINPHERAAAVLREIERQYEPKRQSGWEDYLDLPVGLPSGAIGAALFRTISDVARAKESHRSQSTEPTVVRRPRSVRIRTGRGGRCFVDRRLTGRRNPSGPPQLIPASPMDLNKTYLEHFARCINVFSVNEDSVSPRSPDGIDMEPSLSGEHAEHIRRLEERWRFDTVDEADDDEQRVLIDDFEARYLVGRVTAFSETDLAKLTIEESHIAKASAYAAQAQAPAMRALQAARNEVLQARMEQQARVQQAAARAQVQAQARAAAVAAGLATESNQPSPTTNSNSASSPPHPPPNSLQQNSPNPSPSTPLLQPSTPNPNGQSQPPSSASSHASSTPLPNGQLTNGPQTPQPPPTPLQQFGPQPQQQAALAQQANLLKRVGQQVVPPRPGQQPNGIPRLPMTPQQQPAMTPQQVAERLQQMQQMSQAHTQLNGNGSAPNMLAAEAAMRQAQAHAAATAARSSPSISHQQPADPNVLSGVHSPSPPQQAQMAVPQINGFPFALYQAAQANGASIGAGASGQMNGGAVPFFSVNGALQQQQQAQFAQAVALQMGSLKNGAGGVAFPNGISNGMILPHGQNGSSRPTLIGYPTQLGQQQTPPQQQQPGMWSVPNLSSAAAGPNSMGIPTSTSMPLKMPARQGWSRQNSDMNVNVNGMMGPPTGSPVQQHMSSPTLAGRSSPVRLVNGAMAGRNSPMNAHAGSSPVMDQHGTPQPHRQTPTPSPLGLPQDMVMLPHQSPHLAMQSPAHQQQILGSSPG